MLRIPRVSCDAVMLEACQFECVWLCTACDEKTSPPSELQCWNKLEGDIRAKQKRPLLLRSMRVGVNGGGGGAQEHKKQAYDGPINSCRSAIRINVC